MFRKKFCLVILFIGTTSCVFLKNINTGGDANDPSNSSAHSGSVKDSLKGIGKDVETQEIESDNKDDAEVDNQQELEDVVLEDESKEIK